VTTNGIVNANVPGTYTISYSAVDAQGNSVTNSRTVIVLDSTAPNIICPASIVVDATNVLGNIVTYSRPTALDLCSGTNVSISSQPASGNLFPIGSNTVSCIAVDSASNTGHCSFTITVLGARGVLLDVLSQLLALRPGVANSLDLSNLDQIIAGLGSATDQPLWLDEIHLERKIGQGEFTALLSGMDSLCQLLRRTNSLPSANWQQFVSRIESAERLVANLAVQDAIAAAGAAKRIEQAQQQLDQGDADASAGRCSSCVAHYKNAWNMAVHAILVQSVRVDSHVHIEVLGDANKTYVIQTSTDLSNWTTLATVKAGADGLIQYDVGPPGQSPWRFYRSVSP
jgi:hypothetical protein